MELTGVILAGGRSQRFGSDKAKAMLGERTMMQHVYDLLMKVCQQVIVSGRCEADGLPATTKCIPDKTAFGGPMSGISSVLPIVETPWILIMPCDMPKMTIDIIDTAITAAQKGLTVTWRSPVQKPQPFPLLLNRKDGLEAVKQPGMSMKEFLSQLPVTVIDIKPEQLSKFSNINTTQDLGNIWHKH